MEKRDISEGYDSGARKGVRVSRYQSAIADAGIKQCPDPGKCLGQIKPAGCADAVALTGDGFISFCA